MKRLGESTPSHHLEHISNNQTRWKSFKNCFDSQKTETPMGSLSFSLFSSHLAPSKFSPLPSTSSDPRSQLSRIKCNAVERTDWMTNHHAIYWYVLHLFPKNRLLSLNNHDYVSSTIQNKLLVHQLTPNHQLRLIPLILRHTQGYWHQLWPSTNLCPAKFLPGQLRSVALWIGQNHPERQRNRETEDWRVNVRDLKFVRFAFDLWKYCFKPPYVLLCKDLQAS